MSGDRRAMGGLSSRAAHGFTLIELVVVLLVLAVAVAVVVPGLGRGTEGLRARAEVAGFSAFLRHAREQAVTRGRTHEVRIDPEEHLMVLALPGSDKVRASRKVAQGLRVFASTPTALTVRFLPQGLSSGGSFRLEAPGGRVYFVTVDALTGRVAHRRGPA